jgi:hypothetical protein
VEGATSYRLTYLDEGSPRQTTGDHAPVTISVPGGVLRSGDHFRGLAGFNAGDPAACPPAVAYYEGRFTDAKAYAIF